MPRFLDLGSSLVASCAALLVVFGIAVSSNSSIADEQVDVLGSYCEGKGCTGTECSGTDPCTDDKNNCDNCTDQNDNCLCNDPSPY